MKTFISLLCLPLVGFVFLYRWFISPFFPQCCRFIPSCSAYAIESLQRHGILEGSVLTVRRIIKCHPWGESGYDPVPIREELRKS